MRTGSPAHVRRSWPQEHIALRVVTADPPFSRFSVHGMHNPFVTAPDLRVPCRPQIPSSPTGGPTPNRPASDLRTGFGHRGEFADTEDAVVDQQDDVPTRPVTLPPRTPHGYDL